MLRGVVAWLGLTSQMHPGDPAPLMILKEDRNGSQDKDQGFTEIQDEVPWGGLAGVRRRSQRQGQHHGLVRRGGALLMECTSKRASWWRRYSNLSIVTALALRTVFHLPLRQTEGFLASLIGLMDLDLKTPDHTTLSQAAPGH